MKKYFIFITFLLILFFSYAFVRSKNPDNNIVAKNRIVSYLINNAKNDGTFTYLQTSRGQEDMSRNLYFRQLYGMLAEGGKIHYNSTEKDITSGRGIYRYNNKGVIWDYVDTVAKSIGIMIPSVSWDKDELDKINKNINPDIMEYLEYLFYKQYYAKIHLDEFPASIQPTVASIYANTEVGAIKSIQFAAKTMHKMDKKYLGLQDNEISEVDGRMGDNTRKAIKSLAGKDKIVHDLFETLMALYAAFNHGSLVAGNPEKFLVYLKGWMNRDIGMITA